MLAGVAIGLATALGLLMLYQAAANEWPDNYFSVGPSVDPLVSRKLGKYALFRLGPVLLAGAFASSTASRVGAEPTIAVVTLGAAHLGLTNLRAIWRIVKRADRARRLTPLAYNLVVSVLVAATLCVALATRRISAALIPAPTDLTIALWAGAFAAVFAVWIRRLTFRPGDLGSLLPRVRAEVSPAVLEYARVASLRVNAEAQLVEAILLAESLNRPAWMRSLERRKSVVLHAGSYGVMQVRAPHAISDEESIDLAVARYAGAVVPRDADGIIPAALHALVERHNPDPNFVELVEHIYRLLEPPITSTRHRSADLLPSLIVNEVRREGEEIVLPGSADLEHCRFLFCMLDNGGAWSAWTAFEPLSPIPGGRTQFEEHFPLTVRKVRFQGLDERDCPLEDLLVEVDCRWPSKESAAGAK